MLLHRSTQPSQLDIGKACLRLPGAEVSQINNSYSFDVLTGRGDKKRHVCRPSFSAALSAKAWTRKQNFCAHFDFLSLGKIATVGTSIVKRQIRNNNLIRLFQLIGVSFFSFFSFLEQNKIGVHLNLQSGHCVINQSLKRKHQKKNSWNDIWSFCQELPIILQRLISLESFFSGCIGSA